MIKEPEQLIGELNTDAMEWAKSFKKVVQDNNFTLEEVIDESYMVVWFANVIMCQYDSLNMSTKIATATSEASED